MAKTKEPKAGIIEENVDAVEIDDAGLGKRAFS